MTVHYTYGSSVANREINCPAWPNLAKLAPVIDRESPDAARGTMLHEVMEDLYKSETSVHELVEPLDDYDTQAIHDAFEATEHVLDTYDVYEFVTEKTIRHMDRNDMGGTGDMLAWTDDHFIILDYKFGRVDVTNWDQFLFLFFMASQHEQWAPRMTGKKLVAVIVQPAVSSQPKIEEFTVEELYEWAYRYETAVAKSDAGYAVGTPGDWCKYCPAAPYCPAKRASVNRFMEVSAAQSEELAEGMSLIPAMKEQIKAIEAEVFRVLEKGYAVPGHKLVLKQGRNHWINEADALAALRRQRTIPKADYIDEKLRTAPQVIAAAKKAGVSWQQLPTLVTNASTGTTIAPESDKRPEVKKGVTGVPNALNDILKG